jgi:hypothetical protein
MLPCQDYLRVVLFAKGRGADAASYRPNRDESQWWNRRDALVRCVAAFLFGPPSPTSSCQNSPDHAKSSSERELVLLFDEDWSRMHMRCATQRSSGIPVLFPSEMNIVSVWKEAALKGNGCTVRSNGLLCTLISCNSIEEIPSDMNSKREILEHLQNNCSIDFLREHRLNSSLSVILRKTNKQGLQKTWAQWRKKTTTNVQDRSTNETDSSHYNTLELILGELVKPVSDSETTRTIAGILHESSSNELPYWEQREHKCQAKATDSTRLQVCLFLGAVRDMHPSENRILARVCGHATIPLVEVRLGSVPEFTSKILSVIAYHHNQESLGPAIAILAERQEEKKKKRPREEVAEPSTTANESSPLLHTVCSLPIASTKISVDLKDRDRTLWILVRCIVVSLWRSRLAGNSDLRSNPLLNRISILFEDGFFLTLDQDELVSAMAEQHQAAPSEFQILSVVKQRISSPIFPKRSNTDKSKTEGSYEDFVSALMSQADPQPVLVIDTDDGGDAQNLCEIFRSSPPRNPSNGKAFTLVALVSIAKSTVKEKLVAVLEQARFPILLPRRPIRDKCQDREAATITLLQHFFYQNILWDMLTANTSIVVRNSTSRKKKKKNKRDGH